MYNRYKMQAKNDDDDDDDDVDESWKDHRVYSNVSEEHIKCINL